MRADLESKPAPPDLQRAAEVCRSFELEVSIQAIGALPRGSREQELRDAIDLLEESGFRVIHSRRP